MPTAECRLSLALVFRMDKPPRDLHTLSLLALHLLCASIIIAPMGSCKVREQPDGLHVIDAIMIFRENIRPEWEDKMNAQGGHFQFQLKPNTGGGQIDEYWNNLILGMIGATIEPANMITGARLVDKLSGPRAANVIRLEVWFTNYDDTAAVNTLRRNIEKCMATKLDGTQGQAPRCETKPHTSGSKH